MENQNSSYATLRSLLRWATPGPWQVQDGCSWRRIGTPEQDGAVLCPTNHHRDGHPDLVARDGNLRANLDLIVELRNAATALLDDLDRLRAIEAEAIDLHTWAWRDYTSAMIASDYPAIAAATKVAKREVARG